jgi:hypothetical protein
VIFREEVRQLRAIAVSDAAEPPFVTGGEGREGAFSGLAPAGLNEEEGRDCLSSLILPRRRVAAAPYGAAAP